MIADFESFDLVGLKVYHNTYGMGEVLLQNNKKILVKFEQNHQVFSYVNDLLTGVLIVHNKKINSEIILTRKKLIDEFIKLKKEKNKENRGYSSNNILENSFNYDPKFNRKERDSSNSLVNGVTLDKESNKRRSCSNCINSKNGTCSGLGKPCEDYKTCYTLTVEQISNFPTEMDAEKIRKGKFYPHRK